MILMHQFRLWEMNLNRSRSENDLWKFLERSWLFLKRVQSYESIWSTGCGLCYWLALSQRHPCVICEHGSVSPAHARLMLTFQRTGPYANSLWQMEATRTSRLRWQSALWWASSCISTALSWRTLCGRCSSVSRLEDHTGWWRAVMRSECCCQWRAWQVSVTIVFVIFRDEEKVLLSWVLNTQPHEE